MAPFPPPLLIVARIFAPRADFASLEHVPHTVSLFLDSSVELPLHKACEFGSLRLLNHLWDSPIDSPQDPKSSWSIRSFLRSEPTYRQFQFTLSLIAAAKCQNLEMVKWIFGHLPECHVTRSVVAQAAEAGALEILQYFGENDENREENEGEVEREEIGKRTVLWGDDDATKAARAGHRDVVIWLLENTNASREDDIVMKAAVGSGDVALVEWLQQEIPNLVPSEGTQEAAANGHLEMLKWVREKGDYDREISAGTLLKAAENGHMDIVRWIIDADRKDMGDESDGGGDDSDEWDDFYPRAFGQDFPITSLGGEASLAVGAAAMGGHLEVAKYLHERVATPKTERESEREEGRFRRTLKYISRQIDMFDADKVSVDTMLVAAQNGHLDVVKWLYAEFRVKLGMDMFWLYDDDADKYFSVLDVAAGNGRLEVVKYLHEICQEAAGNAEDQDGLDTGDESMRSGDSIFSDDSWAEEPTKPGCTAAANGHMDVVQWLHRNRNEGCTMDSAAGNGHLDMVKWLHEHTKMGCTTKAMDAAARGGHLEVVKWLHEHTDEGCTSKAMDGAVHSGALDVVKWLHKNLSEGCSKAMVNEAAKRGHLRVLRWLHMNYPADWSTAAMDNAAMGGHFEVVLLLHRVRSEGCSPGPVHMKSPSFDIERWLIEHYPTRVSVEDW